MQNAGISSRLAAREARGVPADQMIFHHGADRKKAIPPTRPGQVAKKARHAKAALAQIHLALCVTAITLIAVKCRATQTTGYDGQAESLLL
jgi:hypothetical protein